MPQLMVESHPKDTSTADLVDTYTRLVSEFHTEATEGSQIETATAPSGVRRYEDQKRFALWRMFASKSISRILAIKTTLNRPHVETTNTVTSLGYESGKSAGNSWFTEFNSRRILTPYFRIDADSAMNVEASLTSSATFAVTATTDLLDVVKRATALISPGAALLTTLNQSRFKDASQFVDQTLAGFFKEAIVEKASNDFAMKDWDNAKLISLYAWLPTGNEITPSSTNRAEDQAIWLGRWDIRAAPAIASISTGKAAYQPAAADGGTPTRCDARCALAGLDAQAVLNFKVDTETTVTQALAGESGIVAARDKLISASSKGAGTGKADDKDKGGEEALALCTLVAAKAQGLGFNRNDVAAIVWAYSHQSFVTPSIATVLRTRANCPSLTVAYDAGLSGEEGARQTGAGET